MRPAVGVPREAPPGGAAAVRRARRLRDARAALRGAARADQPARHGGGCAADGAAVSTQSLDDYFAQAASWDSDRYLQAARSERRAWFAALGGWLCALASTLAVALLVPLKRVEPYVVRVDSSTGVVDVVPAYSAGA